VRGIADIAGHRRHRARSEKAKLFYRGYTRMNADNFEIREKLSNPKNCVIRIHGRKIRGKGFPDGVR
jgi:hypothetical protein